MSDREKDRTKRDQEIAAYVCGDMTSEQTAGFERRMEADEVLRREVEEWRAIVTAAEEWAGEEARGIERVKGLKVPLLPHRKGRRSAPLLGSFGIRLRPALATATVFGLGFLLGALLFGQGPSSRDTGKGLTSPETASVGQPEGERVIPTEAEMEQKRPEATPATPTNREAWKTRVAANQSPVYVTPGPSGLEAKQDLNSLVLDQTTAPTIPRPVVTW